MKSESSLRPQRIRNTRFLVQQIFHATIDSLKSLGFSANKSRALLEASSAIRDRRLLLEPLVRLDNHGALEELLKLRGVGRWTAEYILLRGLGRLTIFTGDDVGARKKLAQFLRKKKPLPMTGCAELLPTGNPTPASSTSISCWSHKEGRMVRFTS
jgi:DNA-3-methyladenine glycosylase II